MKDNILAIIPARSGSKGIKDKNIKNINDKPLIAYTIEAALKSKCFEDVIVSTDCEKYKIISEQYGAWVPFLRSKELAQDESTTNDVVEDVLLRLKKNGKKYNYIMILQPTSPLRDYEDIRNSIKEFKEKKANSLVSMCECEHSPLLSKLLGKEMRLDGFLSNFNRIRRQDLKKFYRLNGAIYLIRVDYFLKYKNFYRENSYAFIMDKTKSIDIDDMNDFEYAEYLIKKKYNNLEEKLESE